MDELILRKLFVHRTDVFAVQTKTGKYETHKIPITDDHLKGHLLGKQTLGTYQLDKDDTVILACIDIDISKQVWSKEGFNVADWKPKIDQQISAIKNKLAEYGIVGYTEMSGFKGAHVWYFFEDPVNAGTVKDMNMVMFGGMDPVDENISLEFFPKQDHIDEGGFGNLIKLPLGIHKKSGNFSYFLDDISGSISYTGRDEINKVINPIDSIFINCSVLNGIRKRAAQGYLNHTERLTLGYILLNVEGGEKELRSLIEMQDDYDPKKTDYYINHIRSKNYKPLTCSKLQSTEMNNMCPGPCRNIKNGKSPIAFFYRHTGKLRGSHTGQDEDIGNVTSKLDMFKKVGTEFYLTGGKNGTEMISNFIVNITDEITRDDGITIRKELKGQIVAGDRTWDYSIKSSDYANDEKFKASIYDIMTNAGLYCEWWGKLRLAINKYTNSKQILIKEIFGYDGPENNPYERYLSPSTLIDVNGIHKNEEIIVDMSGQDKAQWLDIIHIPEEDEIQKLKTHIEKDLLTLSEFGITHSTIGHTFLPIIRPWIQGHDHTKYTLFIKGSSGSGKSFLAESCVHFYGKGFMDYPSWGSTHNQIEVTGFLFKDALFLADDWKKQNLTNMKGSMGILQRYADGSSRGRLNRDGSVQNSKPIRGTMIVTGEDMVEGQSSVTARIITLVYPDQRANMKAGREVLKNRNNYSAITARYIHHVMNMSEEEKSKMLEFQQDMHQKLHSKIENAHNAIRISRNISLLFTSYFYFSNWFWNKKKAKEYQDRLYDYLVANMFKIVTYSADERPAEKFWYTLKDLLATKKVRLQPTNSLDEKIDKHTTVVGFSDSSEDYLLLDIALREVQRYLKSAGEDLGFTNKTIIGDLYHGGFIKTDKPLRKVFNNQEIYVYSTNLRK
jgi:hypothetical protein